MGIFTLHTLLFHLSLKSFNIHFQILLFSHQSCQIHREPHCCIEVMGGIPWEFGSTLALHLICNFIELPQTLVQGLVERFLFFFNNIHHKLLLSNKFRESIFHHVYHNRNNFVEKTRFGSQNLLTIPYSSTQHSAKHISSAIIRRNSTISDREGQSPYMISNNSVSHINSVLIVSSHLACVVPSTSDVLNGFKNRLEYVCIIV
mmetsp:Transcript_33711/g.42468  ORF Transcript_33711/g.42468 Transcript_33711/m.42468 type:complete len:203 (+) Transcript_33711:1777-2385(+)